VTASAEGPATVATYGIDIVRDLSLQSRPVDEKQRLAFWAAWDFAERNSPDIGYPWVDGESASVHFRAASPDGRALLESFQGDTPFASMTARVEEVEFSFAELEGIRANIEARVLARDPIYTGVAKSEPDHINNRIIITTNHLTEALLADLAKKYGTGPVAVRELPGFEPYAGAGGRQHDYSPFWGGAKIYPPIGGYCSTAFGWEFPNGDDGMLTAAHCAHSGGDVSRPDANGNAVHMGTVRATWDENWDPGYGTVPYGTQHTNKGDVAAIRLDNGKESRARIYYGGINTNNYVQIVTVSPPPVQGDPYVVGGATSGDVGGYEVLNTHVNIYYFNLAANARNMVEGSKVNDDDCNHGGDSGGAVYWWNSGGFVAEGVMSGLANILSTCFTYYTDINLTLLGPPGTIKLAS
jgi:hypothetical protein